MRIVDDDSEIYPQRDDCEAVSEPYGSAIVRHDQLEVYQLAFTAAGTVFEVSKGFPKEERFSLTDQVRKSSRSVCANIAEGWRRRRYRAAFQSSLNIAEAEAAETQTWIHFAAECGYLQQEPARRLWNAYETVIGKLVVMICNPDPWILKSTKE